MLQDEEIERYYHGLEEAAAGEDGADSLDKELLILLEMLRRLAAGSVQYTWKASEAWSLTSIQMARLGSACVNSIMPPLLKACKVYKEESSPSPSSLEFTQLLKSER